MPNNWFGFWQGCTARRDAPAHSARRAALLQRPPASTGRALEHCDIISVMVRAGRWSRQRQVARRSLVAPPAGMPSRPHWPGDRVTDSRTTAARRDVQASILTTSDSTAEYRRCGRGVRANQRCPPRSTPSAPCLIQHAACRTIMHTRVSGGLAPTWSCMAAHGAPARTTSAAHMLTACATAAENARAAGWLRPGPRNPAAGPPVQQPFFQMLHYPPAATQALNRAA